MDRAAQILLIAIGLQSLAAVLALRLNWRYRRSWAWSLISAGILLMAVRLAVSLYRTTAFGDIDPVAEEAVGLTAAVVSLLVSMFILAGVAMIDPIFREIARAELLLREERDGLQAVIRVAAVEFQMARRIQRILLPTGSLQSESIDIAGTEMFVDETGGDLFDYFRLPDGSVLVYLADVSGHGLGPAMIATQIRTYLRAVTESGSSDPAALLWRLNHYLVENTSHHFVTMFLAVIDPMAGQLAYASAGHPAWLLDASGQTQQLEGMSIPLGIDSGLNPSTSRVVSISPGSLLLLATDGVFEAHSPGDELFGVDRLLEIVKANRDQSALAISERLQREVQDFSGSSLHDDVTTVVVKHLQPSTAGNLEPVHELVA